MEVDEMDSVEVYYVKVYHPTRGVFLSEALELDIAGRKVLTDLLTSCMSNREALSFNDVQGGWTLFPYAVLEECIVRLVEEGENEEGNL